jgi:hypothetical protein
VQKTKQLIRMLHITNPSIPTTILQSERVGGQFYHLAAALGVKMGKNVPLRVPQERHCRKERGTMQFGALINSPIAEPCERKDYWQNSIRRVIAPANQNSELALFRKVEIVRIDATQGVLTRNMLSEVDANHSKTCKGRNDTPRIYTHVT